MGSNRALKSQNLLDGQAQAAITFRAGVAHVVEGEAREVLNN